VGQDVSEERPLPTARTRRGFVDGLDNKVMYQNDRRSNAAAF